MGIQSEGGCLLKEVGGQVVLPLDDSVVFKDAMDPRIDADLKKNFSGAKFACRPVMALISFARALRVWASDVESTVRQGIDVEAIALALQELKISADFVAEAAVDLVQMSAKVIALSVMAHSGRQIRRPSRHYVPNLLRGNCCFEKMLNRLSREYQVASRGCFPSNDDGFFSLFKHQ